VVKKKMFNEKAIGKDGVNVGSQIPLHDMAKWHAHWQIKKFVGDYPGMTALEIEAAGVKPYETLDFEGNCLLNSGINSVIMPALTGDIPHPVDGTYGCIGVGDGTLAATAAQTGLQAATNHLWNVLSAKPTTGTVQKIVATATFASADAVWVWAEICLGEVASGLPLNSANPTNGYALNRLVQAMGTKAAGTSWVATLTITLS
jgi:hypothetical protein